jgi:hypothetical protein
LRQLWCKAGYQSKKGRTSNYLKAGLVICVSLILVIFPATRFFMNFGQDFSEKVSVKPVDESQVIAEYSLNRTVGNNDFQITVTSAHDG